MSLRNSMKFIALAGVSALTHAAYATQPPCVTSDGARDTACGTGALYSLNGGNSNTAMGTFALESTTTGVNNTAMGTYALTNSAVASGNTAIGTAALLFNISGNGNSATGAYALESNTTGTGNTAAGAYAILLNTSGNNNTASGIRALSANTTGSNGTASGNYALSSNTTGNFNSAFGYQALINSQSGLANIGVGPFAGRNVVLGQLNIDIGSWGSVDESNTIRIGLPQYHQHTYIAGIGNSPIAGGTPVVVNPATGQLGFAGSSERYKTDIGSLGNATERLAQLRPVRFHIKADPSGAIQYGLIAEEVDEVYPELVIRDADGNIQGVRYDELAPMLLNEVQKQQQVNAAQAVKIASLELREQQKSEAQDAETSALKAQLTEMRAALAALQLNYQLVGQH